MEPTHRFHHIFTSFSIPGNVFIFTDSIRAEKLISEDIHLLSHFLIAMIIVKNSNTGYTFNNYEASNDHNQIIAAFNPCRSHEVISKPVFLLDLPRSLNFSSEIAKHIYNSFLQSNNKCNLEHSSQSNISSSGVEQGLILETSVRMWKPTIMIVLMQSNQSDMIEIESSSNQLALFSDSFEDFKLHLDSDIYGLLFETQRSLQIISAWEIYNVKERRVLSRVTTIFLPRQYYEDIRVEHGISLERNAKRRSNFFGEKFTAVVKETESSNQDWGAVEQREDDTFYLAYGYIANLYWDLKTFMNFTESILVGDSPWVAPNGSVVGKTIEMLNSEQGDFSLNKVSLNPTRARGLTFLIPTHNSIAYVLFKQPSPNSLRNVITAPFKKELWLTLAVFWLGLGTFFHIRLFLLPRISNIFRSQALCSERDRTFLGESWIWCFAVVCQKSFYLDPQTGSLKLKFIAGSLLSIISYTAYSASIVSSLAVSNIPVKKFSDLTTSNFLFTVHAQSQPFQNLLQGFIKTYDLRQKVATVTTEKEVSHLFTVLSSPKWSSSTGDTSVQSTHKAFLSYADIFYKVAEFQNFSTSFLCNHLSFFKIETRSSLSKSAMLVKKGSEFKEVLNFMILYLREFGLIYRNDFSYNSKNIPHCLPEEVIGLSLQPMDFSDIFTILIVLFIGAPLTMLMFVAEVYMSRYRRHAKRKSDAL